MTIPATLDTIETDSLVITPRMLVNTQTGVVLIEAEVVKKNRGFLAWLLRKPPLSSIETKTFPNHDEYVAWARARALRGK